VLGVGVFFLLPALTAGWVDKALKLGSWWSNLFEGFLRLAILVAYMALVGKMPDIKRTSCITARNIKPLTPLSPCGVNTSERRASE
jgi:hypothetical protein